MNWYVIKDIDTEGGGWYVVASFNTEEEAQAKKSELANSEANILVRYVVLSSEDVLELQEQMGIR